MRVIVEFLSSHQPYNTGERAGFSQERANHLVHDRRVARVVEYVPESEDDEKVVAAMREKLAEKQRARAAETTEGSESPTETETDTATGDEAGAEAETDEATETSGTTGKKTPRRGRRS